MFLSIFITSYYLILSLLLLLATIVPCCLKYLSTYVFKPSTAIFLGGYLQKQSFNFCANNAQQLKIQLTAISLRAFFTPCAYFLYSTLRPSMTLPPLRPSTDSPSDSYQPSDFPVSLPNFALSARFVFLSPSPLLSKLKKPPITK